MLEQEFQYYIDHQVDLVKEYNNKHIVIQGEKVIGSYDSHREAYNETVKKEKLGTFLIHQCFPGEESYTEYRVSQSVIDRYDSVSPANSETTKTEKLDASRILHFNSYEDCYNQIIQAPDRSFTKMEKETPPIFSYSLSEENFKYDLIVTCNHLH